MIDSSVGVVLVTLSTVNTAVMVWLGFLYRPSRSSATWTFAFTLAMISSYGWVAADAMGSAPLLAGCAAAMLGVTVFVWVGLRARRGAEGYSAWIATAFTLACCIVLPLAAGADVFGLAFRVAFAIAAVFAALTLAELTRIEQPMRHQILPLALASVGFIIFAVLSIADGVLRGSPASAGAADQVEFIRDLNSMASIVYSTAAVITLLLLTREGASSPSVPLGQTPFRATAEDRLARARAVGDRWWCVLDIRLDDPEDLRDAFSAADFARIADRFTRDVRAVLPPDADLEQQGDTGVVVLLPRPEGAVRQLLSRLLEGVATPDPAQPIAVRLSASIGWASVDTTGYDLDALLAAARAASAEAHLSGGDRWERITAAVGWSA